MEITIQTSHPSSGKQLRQRDSPTLIQIQDVSSKEVQSVPFYRLFRFAELTDTIIMIVGSVMSVVVGCSIPIFSYLTGSIIDSFSQANAQQEARQRMFEFLVLGAVSLLAAWIMYTSWISAGERQAIRCRKQYFKSILRQELAWFDTQNQAAISANFAMDSATFQEAIGEKISKMILIISMFLSGIGVSLYLGWFLTVITLAYLPFLIWTYYKGIVVKGEVEDEQKTIYQQSDSRAQEIFPAIRLVK